MSPVEAVALPEVCRLFEEQAQATPEAVAVEQAGRRLTYAELDLQAHRLASRLEMGIIWLNTWMLRDLRTPFGGMKDSGMGREGGVEALRFFTEPKNVCLKISEGNAP